MKTTKKADNETIVYHAKLEKAFPDWNDKWGILATVMGAAEALGQELMEAFEPHQLSEKAKYSILQYHSLRLTIANILQDKNEGKPRIGKHMPIHDWDDEESWEKKFIFVVKNFYDHLKKEGKL
jgi:hypothetical protein